jgi:hypothetical protein
MYQKSEEKSETTTDFKMKLGNSKKMAEINGTYPCERTYVPTRKLRKGGVTILVRSGA